MLDLFEEMAQLIAALDQRGVQYALVGGLAMAVWGFPRATVDIDLLVPTESLRPTESVAESLGYIIEARPMTFSGGAVVIHRRSKIDPDGGDVLMLDLLLVTSALEEVWAERQTVEWARGRISVVSREGLIRLKRYRSSGTDLDDIAKLQEAQ